MAVEGVIAARTQALLTTTWDALVSDPKGTGEGPLATAIDIAKEDVLGIIPSPVAEAQYPLIVIDYVAKMAVLQIIPIAIDYWMSQSITETVQTPSEVTTYTDRAEMLRKLRDDLLAETRSNAADIAVLVGFRRRRGRSVPAVNTMADPLLTPDPQEFPRPYIATTRS